MEGVAEAGEDKVIPNNVVINKALLDQANLADTPPHCFLAVIDLTVDHVFSTLPMCILL